MPIGNNCGLLSSDVSELNCCVPCDTNIPAWKSLMYHMRRRLLGHVVQVIHLATDALKVLTNEKHWTKMTNGPLLAIAIWKGSNLRVNPVITSRDGKKIHNVKENIRQ